MLGSPILYFKGMRLVMFQLSSFYCKFSMWDCRVQRYLKTLKRFRVSYKGGCGFCCPELPGPTRLKGLESKKRRKF